MDFPFGHHHRRGDDDDDDDRRRRNHPGFHPPPGVHHVSHDRGYEPPPTYTGGSVNHVTHDPGYDATPPFSGNPVQHISHDSGPGYAPPPPFFRNPVHHVSHDSGPGYSPPPPFFSSSLAPESLGQHVAHESQYGSEGASYGREEDLHRSRPGYSETVSHESSDGGAMNRQRTVRIFTKADENYSLSIIDGKLILTRTDRSDERQHWIKDLKYSTKIKDEEGFPGFALVNKATGEALKHSFGATHPVDLDSLCISASTATTDDDVMC
ncbi:hypothetical protein KSP39_PZI008838 [Platanthera zijinensis]|uniref:PH domain-containing protein n=1 Tax=Platanthera zijinensis TaxID=2320716 RepID=A0AAP0BLR3_9ASPA